MEIECKGLKRDYEVIKNNERFIRNGKEYTKLYKESEDGEVLVNLAYTDDGDVEFFDDECQVMKKGCQQTELRKVKGGQVFLYEYDFYIRACVLDGGHTLGVVNLRNCNISYLYEWASVDVIDAKLVNA